ncbi:MAG: pilus assembly protein [Oligoflexia bacterium]|nr:pilus assembly protein [Oligoflexia bacterium]
MTGADKRKTEAGQSTIEFALALTLMMGFVLFFVQLSLLFAYGNLVHYATFMAARAYLAAGMSNEDQQRRAQDTIVRLLKKSQGEPGLEKYAFIAQGEGGSGEIPGLSLGPSPQYQPKNADLSWMQGVRYSFRGRVSMVPIGAPKNGNPNANSVTLTSESWLGREKSFGECMSFMEKLGGARIDNGC